MTLNDSCVLIIGGAGFVGSHLVDQLTREPVREMVVLDNFVRGTRANLRQAMKDDWVRVVEGSITDLGLLRNLMQGTSYVFHLAALRPMGYEVISLGSDEPIVLNEAIRLLEELAGKKATLEYKPRHPADVRATWADIRKAERLMGRRPQMRFEDGVRRLVSWYQVNQDWAKDVTTC